MRRIGLILLIVLLPLQSIWIAAARACPHENQSAGKPVADHVHAHAHAGSDGAADDVSAGPDGSPGGSAGSGCHDPGSATMVADDRVAANPTGADIVPSPYTRFFADCFLESALRPPVPSRS